MSEPRTTVEPLTTEQIREAKRIAEAATEGPWCHDDHVVNPGDSSGMWHVYELQEDDGPLFSTSLGTQADMQFCAHARTFVPAACDELLRLQKTIDTLRETCGPLFRMIESGSYFLLMTKDKCVTTAITAEDATALLALLESRGPDDAA